MTTPPTQPHPLSPDPRARVLSGMRPTGRLHLGNYMGALYNWVQLQHQYDCFFFIADYHALTTEYQDPSRLKQNVYEIALDFLAAGLDPEKCTIFIQSHVPQHAELNLIFSMFTPLSWLERVPTYKDQQEQLREKDLATYGFLGYPLLQSADILLYQPDFVPVGQDQVAHVELTREVARKFNHLYSDPNASAAFSHPGSVLPPIISDILPDPQVLLTPSPKLPGTDGRKMSKSYGNSILMTDPGAVVLEKALTMSNGGQRPTQLDPGDPEICPVGDMHRIFSTPEVDAFIRHGCRTASIRCDQCKQLMGSSILAHTQPIANRRRALEADPDAVWNILDEGAARARQRAEQTMVEVRRATGLSRDRSGVRNAAPAFSNDSRTNYRDLANLSDWWNLETGILARNLRDIWRQNILPTEAALRPDSDEVFVTRSQQRVLVAAAQQNGSDTAWLFSAKPKSYEFLVLLCWDSAFQLHDFVVPQKLYVGPWTAAKRAAGKDHLTFAVDRVHDKYFLRFATGDAIDITNNEADYKIVGG
jgi:tryptophanyl-tRNA synthetase